MNGLRPAFALLASPLVAAVSGIGMKHAGDAGL